MSVQQDKVVGIARRWIGTPYRHQASAEGAGCDCLGLLRGIWREIHGEEPAPVPPYTMYWGEVQRDERLWRAARRFLIEKPIEDEAAGDVLLFRMRKAAVAKHLGIQVEAGSAASFVHAYSGHNVTESPLSRPWRRKIVARFAWPEESD
ncbi:MAG: peptidase [Pseudomonadota bacterium]